MKKAAILLLPVLLLLNACGNEPGQKTTTNSSISTLVADPNLPPSTYLEGIYATSTAPGKGVENLFDANPATLWQTQPGTGPDEGIMLYFQEALPIASIEVVASEGSFDKDLRENEWPITIYTNGQVAKVGKPNQPIAVLQNGLVKSLFVRFEFTGKEKSQGANLDSYPNDAFIAIRELKIMNDKGESIHLVPPRRVKGSAIASSTLAPEAAYSPANLFDSRKEFVWAEGSAASGEGEELTFQFEQAVNITAIKIWNGYQRSDEHFSTNARLRDFDFGVNGAPSNMYTLRDTKEGQKIELQVPAKGSAFTLKIKSVYPGKTYKDLAISDLVFYDGDQPFILHSALPEKYQAEHRAKAASSPLGALLDKRIANKIKEENDLIIYQSLILRSDGTFVMYSEDSSSGDPAFADGNWEMLSGSQVKIFGKWTDFINITEYYNGSSQQSPTRIFKDVLTIDAKKVTGTKMVGTFYLK